GRGGRGRRAEAVEGRDPGAVERAREAGPPPLDEPGADAAAQLAGGLLGVRDDEDGLDVDPLVAHRARKALDEHARLPGAGSRRHEDDAARVDSSLLFRVEV